MCSSYSDVDSLENYLTSEKLRCTERIHRMSVFLKDPSLKSSLTLVESLEIIRQNAESDYRVILDLLKGLKENYSSREFLSSETESTKSLHNNIKSTTTVSALTSPTKITTTSTSSSSSTKIRAKNTEDELNQSEEDDFELEDPLSFSSLHDSRIPKDFEHNFEEDAEENVFSRRFVLRPSSPTSGKSLPVPCPLRGSESKNRLSSILDSEELPENVHLEIASIAKSLHGEAYAFGDLPKNRFSYNAQ